MQNDGLEWISLAEASRRLSVSERTVRRLVNRGELKSRRIGFALVVRSDSLPCEGQLLSQHEAAECLSCAPDDICSLVRDGSLKAHPVGSLQRFGLSELEARRAKLEIRLQALREAN